MTYYKIIKDDKIIDVNNQFFKFLKKHLIAVSCDPNVAEAIRSSDGKFYTTNWLKPLPSEVQLETVKAVVILEEEYNLLKNRLSIEEVVISQPVEITYESEETEKPVLVEVQEQEKQQVVSIRDLYEEIKRLKEELNSIKK